MPAPITQKTLRQTFKGFLGYSCFVLFFFLIKAQKWKKDN